MYCNLYKIYVLSIISYGFSFYFTTSKINMQKLEKIQKYFTRRLFDRIYGKNSRPEYSERLKLFDLLSLESFCVQSDLLLLFRLLNNQIYSEFRPIFSKHKPTRFIFRSGMSSAYRNSFFHRSLVLWNKYVSPEFDASPSDPKAFISFLIAHRSDFSLW